jgi:uncharacterized membrane protein YphA (DoxX/SURF4 family)
VFLGIVLLVAAWGKVLDPESFADLVRTEGLDFLLPAPVVAFLGIAAEVGVAILLLSGVRTGWSLSLATALVVFFLFLTGRTYWLALHGEVDPARSCGCFGNLVERTPAEAFWQDALLLVPALALAWVGRGPSRAAFPSRRVVGAAVGTACVLVFSLLAPDMDLDDLATRLRPGLTVGEICTGKAEGRVCLKDVIPDLEQGRYLFVIADLADPLLADHVAAWNERALTGESPTLWLLTAASLEAVEAFRLEKGATFLISEAPASLLRPLHRRLPRTFRVEDGKVVATSSGYPDVASPEPPPGG